MTLPSLLAAAAVWAIAIAGAVLWHRARPRPPLPHRPVDPDRHPAPIDPTYYQLEHLYRLPARRGDTQ